jgi:hypothetical protein
MLGLPNEAKEAFFLWQNIVREKTGRQTVSSRQLFLLLKRMFNFFVELYIKDDSFSNRAEYLIR